MSETSGVERVLAEHRVFGFNGSETRCSCSREWRSSREHTAHVAAAVLDFLREVAADEGVRVVAEVIDRRTGHHMGVESWVPMAADSLGAYLRAVAGDE